MDRTELMDDIQLNSLIRIDENAEELQVLNTIGSNHRLTATSFLALPPIGMHS